MSHSSGALAPPSLVPRAAAAVQERAAAAGAAAAEVQGRDSSSTSPIAPAAPDAVESIAGVAAQSPAVELPADSHPPAASALASEEAMSSFQEAAHSPTAPSLGDGAPAGPPKSGINSSGDDVGGQQKGATNEQKQQDGRTPSDQSNGAQPTGGTPAGANTKKKLREAHVPSSPLGRVVGFAGLGASLALGALRDNASSWFSGGNGAVSVGGSRGHPLMTERNAERLADALCRMRGAALKLGQMLSIQDENVLPPQLLAALERVREGADVMPAYQLEGVVVEQLGEGWRAKLANFGPDPVAAASIGQVHQATLLDGRTVAMKIQYPGVGRSIESDVDNVMRLVKVANVLPKGAYVEEAVRVAKEELALECNYTNELTAQARFKQLIEGNPALARSFHVPDVVPELSSEKVLTTEWVAGVPIDQVASMPEEVRNNVATRLLALTLTELFQWQFMQTDPNWSNFLYDRDTDRLHLIDFGAARDYPKSFVDDYLRMVKACAEQDSDEVVATSVRLGFLTGEESRVMLDAHCKAGFVVGLPFAEDGLYDFGASRTMTREVTDLGGIMLKHRLTPPPQEAYSLHRKLSGAFLSCIKLRAKVPCRELFMDCYETHFSGDLPAGVTATAAV
eukprot:CAMPEP_0117679190 /NCGR_PEP_ID=MMETSP0804-20121206/17687_1 /TAXON_ID=1074897 /ORGANISM="Tetraselmis astigmatica, Strain CCMP880" /LENGTH=623 /DNA_ID=CAMNT_0005488605 /DNA_START=206 /DNA_END=2077 /DNA_ORIENTATION=+